MDCYKTIKLFSENELFELTSLIKNELEFRLIFPKVVDVNPIKVSLTFSNIYCLAETECNFSYLILYYK
jgi:hypothetical protein